MGRIKTKQIKRISSDLIENYDSEFRTDYLENRSRVEQLANIKSKKLRNVIAGYVTRLKKMQKE